MPFKATPERVSAFSDAVFAILITVLVLELRPPEQPTFQALGQLWPTWISYAVSYLFIATVWVDPICTASRASVSFSGRMPSTTASMALTAIWSSCATARI